jgi:hypothetical protein
LAGFVTEENLARANQALLKLTWLWFSLLVFTPRLLGLNLFLTADEPLFLDHAREFGEGLAYGDWRQTLGIGYPGVTVAGWAAPVVSLAGTELGAYTAGRMATALLNGILLLLIYRLAGSLLGRRPALIGVVLLAFDPYSLAYSRLLQVDAPLGFLMTLTGLSFLLWLQQDRIRWSILSGVFAGLALLTKSTALLLGPMLGAILLGWALASKPSVERRWWPAKIKGGLLMVVITGFVFWSLWPAMWVDPVGTLGLTFGKLFSDQEAGTGNLGMFWMGRFVEDPGPLFYVVAFILKATPWLVVGLALSLMYCLVRSPYSVSTTYHPPRITHHVLRFTLSLWLFSLTYLLFMTIASKKSVRYLLPAFPVFYLLAGLAYDQLCLFLSERVKTWRSCLPSRFPAPLLPVLLLMTLVLFTVFYHPYYLTYYNPLVLGWRWAPHTLLVGWGEGLDEAARYLNQQPGQRVAAWYEWLFPVFYRKGEVQPVVPQENLITADRTVLYINQVQRDIPGPNIIHYFRMRRQPEYTVWLAGIDYAWVYPGPIAGFQPPGALAYPLGGEFGGEARLLGYGLQQQPVKGGTPLIVTLYWQSLVKPAADRFVYVRLVDAEGRIWARADSPPVMGLWPTTQWQAGMFVEDAQELPIPAETPPGVYRLEVGFYEPTSGQPLAATGQPVGQGGGLLLGEVMVE